MKKIKKEEQEEKILEEKDIVELKRVFSKYLPIAGIVLIIALLIIGSVYYIDKSRRLTYNNVLFEKEYFGKILFYIAKIPLADGSILSIDFRNKPQELEVVEVQKTGDIIPIANKIVYLTYGETGLCEDNVLAAATLGGFLGDIGLKVEGALRNKTEAKKINMTFADCKTYPNNTVIMLYAGNENKIKQTAKNCYELTFKDCEIQKVVEKFELTMLEEYVNRN